MNRTGRTCAHFLLVGASLLFVYALGITNLKSVPISHSESNTQKNLYKTYLDPPYSVAQTLESVSERSEQHGPLYFVLLNIWRGLVGRDLFSLRLLSIFFGLLSTAFAYRLAAITRDYEAALLAAVLTSFCAFLFFYSQIVRMYSLLPLLAAVTVWGYWKVVSASGDVPWWRWLLLASASCALIYVHYYGIFVLAAIGLYHLVFAPKDHRWLGVCLAMLCAALLFSPWLPVVVKALSQTHIPQSGRLSLIETVGTLAGIYTNGLYLFLLLAFAPVVLRYRGLSNSQRYIVLSSLFIASLMVLANVFLPLLYAKRMRYTIVLLIPLNCAFAVGLSLLPWRRAIRSVVLVAWIITFFTYSRSNDLALYTNQIDQGSDATPAYQVFHYEADLFPSRQALILSFHPDKTVDSHKILSYYRWVLSDWSHLVHISYDNSGEPVIQSGLSTYATLDDIAANSNGIWVIYDPRQTDLDELDVYVHWFSSYFQGCRSYFESNRAVIGYYLKRPIPCELVNDDQPIQIDYDNGAKLGNVLTRQSADELLVYFWWWRGFDSDFAFSLQLFDEQAVKVQQTDAVIGGDPIDVASLDISTLPEGNYRLELIVYDYLTRESQPGAIVSPDLRVERAAILDHVMIGA